MTEYTFTFKSGLTVRLQFVKFTFISAVRAAARKKALADHGEPVCPTYTVTAAGGSSYVHEHTAESVGREPDNEELQKAWETYTNAERAIDLDVNTQTCRAYVIRGVADEVPQDWLDDQAYWGIAVPTDPRDLKWTWVFDASTGWDEILSLVLAVQQINPVEEFAAAAEAGFRDSVGAPGTGDDAGTGEAEVKGGEPGGEDAELVLPPAPGLPEGDEELGD